MDISRRKAFGLFAGVAGGAGLAGCVTAETGGAPISPVDVAFDHGVASGDATSEAVILWTRVTPFEEVNGPIPVTLHYSLSEESIQSLDGSGAPTRAIVEMQTLTTSASRDYTVKFDATGLMPDRIYFYRFGVMGPNGMVWSPVGKTRTLPASGGEQLRAAVVSCSNWPFGFFNVYKAIAERDDVDVVMHLGDYIYEYGRDSYGGEVGAQIGREHLPAGEIITLADYRMRHAQYKSDPDTQAAHAAMVVLRSAEVGVTDGAAH